MGIRNKGKHLKEPSVELLCVSRLFQENGILYIVLVFPFIKVFLLGREKFIAIWRRLRRKFSGKEGRERIRFYQKRFWISWTNISFLKIEIQSTVNANIREEFFLWSWFPLIRFTSKNKKKQKKSKKGIIMGCLWNFLMWNMLQFFYYNHQVQLAMGLSLNNIHCFHQVVLLLNKDFG